jgi:hypothetical protein
VKRIFSYYVFLIITFIFFSTLLISNVAKEMNQREILALHMSYYGGPTDCVALQGEYAYIGEGTRVTTLDISDLSHPKEVGKSPILPGFVRSIELRGQHAYAATSWDGLQVLNIANPKHPVNIASVRTHATPVDLDLAGEYAYVVAHWGGGMAVIDISHPAHPLKVKEVNLPGGNILSLAIAGDYAYVTDQEYGLFIIDISNPTLATHIDTLNFPGAEFGIDVDMDRNLAYLGAKDLNILNITNPASPRIISTFDLSLWNPTRTLLAADNKVFIGRLLIDVYDSLNPYLITDFSYTPRDVEFWGDYAFTPGDVEFWGDYAFIANLDRGLHIFNIGDPFFPDEIGFHETEGPSGFQRLNNQSDMEKVNDHIYMTAEQKLHVIDISMPRNPRTVSIQNHGGGPIELSGNYAYVGNSIYDIANLSDPIFLARFGEDEWIVGLELEGNYLFSVDSNERKTYIRDISIPGNPHVVSSIEGRVPVIQGDYAYALTEGEIQIYDITSINAPFCLGRCVCATVGFSNSTGVLNESFLYVLSDSGEGFYIVNVADPHHPTVESFQITPGFSQYITINGGYLFLGDESKGVRVYDIMTPASPVEKGVFRTARAGSSMVGAFERKIAYIGEEAGGLHILRLPTLVNSPIK